MKEIKINEIEGFRIGHAQDEKGGTGCTAIICEKGAYAGVDVRGGGPATRETQVLKSENLADQIHCVMLSGGSAYGLEAGCGAMDYLEEKGAGFDVGVGTVALVCGASLFDLVVGDPKCRPDKAMGMEACKNSENTVLGKGEVAEGNVGAGTGASVGKYLGMGRSMKSGLGTYAVQNGAVKCGAIVSVNCLGDVFDAETGKQIAGLLSEDQKSLIRTDEIMFESIEEKKNVFSGNTTIGCIITNVKLTKAQCNKIASMTHNGYARAIKPVHTTADGDTIFVMTTGEVEASQDAFGALAAEIMAIAIKKAIITAEPAYGLKAASDFE